MERIQPMDKVLPLLAPQYPPGYYQKFQRLKCLLKKQQYTEEGSKLAEEIIAKLQTNYNCWLMKKRCLQSGSTSIEYEEVYSREVLLNKVKNFQIWEYRRFMCEISKRYSQEYALVDEALAIESKNYHAWSYRAWLVSQAKNWEQQLQKIRKYIKEDPRNNSVWSYRFYIVSEIVKSKPQIKIQLLEAQIKHAFDVLTVQLQNQPLWNYLRGFFPSIKLKKYQQKSTLQSYSLYPQIQTICTQISQQTNKEITQALVTLVHIYSQESSTHIYAKDICQILSVRDYQKSNYWKWVQINL